MIAGIAGAPAAADRPPRSGMQTPAGRSWHLVGLGDSITSGEDCPGCVRFLDLYAKQTTHTTATAVSVINLARPGMTSTDLLAALSDPGTAQNLASADIVTITIGANDFAPMLDTALHGQCGGEDGLGCFTGALAELPVTLSAILARIHRLRSGNPTAIRMLGYWNVFLDGAVANTIYGPAFQGVSSKLTRQVNTIIAQVARAHHAVYVDLYEPFKGPQGDGDDTDLLAADGDHPNQVGHQVIAGALSRCGYSPLWTRA